MDQPRSSPLRTLRAFRHHRPAVVLRAASASALWRGAGGLLQAKAPPSLRDFHAIAHGIHLDPGRAAVALAAGAEEEDLEPLVAEYRALEEEVAERYRSTALTAPEHWAVEAGTARLVYLLVRLRRPAVVLETGVANGHLSFFLLRALEANGAGHLHSVDVRRDVGGLLTGRERERWSLHVLDAGAPERAFAAVVAGLGPIDLFFHDADHSYLAQRFEYETALPAMAPGGLLASDDVQENGAFLEFCRRHDLAPEFLLDTRKVCGGAVAG